MAGSFAGLLSITTSAFDVGTLTSHQLLVLGGTSEHCHSWGVLSKRGLDTANFSRRSRGDHEGHEAPSGSTSTAYSCALLVAHRQFREAGTTTSLWRGILPLRLETKLRGNEWHLLAAVDPDPESDYRGQASIPGQGMGGDRDNQTL
jgi:hypothetical protein